MWGYPIFLPVDGQVSVICNISSIKQYTLVYNKFIVQRVYFSTIPGAYLRDYAAYLTVYDQVSAICNISSIIQYTLVYNKYIVLVIQ